MNKVNGMESTIRLKQAAELVGLSEASLRILVHRGEGPKAFRIGARIIAFHASDVMAWLQAREIKSQNKLTAA